MIRAFSTGNILDLNGALSVPGAATTKFITANSENQFRHVTVDQVVQRTSVDVSVGTDPKFPPDTVVVAERGYERATTRMRDTGVVVSVQQLQLDDRYQMQEGSGRFTIADWDLSQQPVAVIPALSPIPTPSPSLAPSPSSAPTPAIMTGPPTASADGGGQGSGDQQRQAAFLALIGLGLVLSAGGAVAATPRSRNIRALAEAATAAAVSTKQWRLEIRTMGKLAVLEGETDHAPVLLAHPGQGVLWFYMLALAIEGSRPRRLRDEVGEEMWPKQRSETRKERMRTRLSQRKRNLPTAIAERILDDGETIEFDLSGCLVDGMELIRLSNLCESDPQLKSDVLRDEVAALIEQARGPFMEFWEDLEKRAIEGEGDTATRAIFEELRGRLERCRVDLLLAVGRGAAWRNQAGAGVNALEEALELRPDRQDVASALADAYDKVGRGAEARHLRETGGR